MSLLKVDECRQQQQEESSFLFPAAFSVDRKLKETHALISMLSDTQVSMLYRSSVTMVLNAVAIS